MWGKRLLLFCICATVFCSSQAQDNVDGAKLEKEKRAAHKLENTLEGQREKLGNLEGKLKNLESKMNKEKARAQKEANQTDKVSTKLSKDPTNKRLNRKAHKASRSSKRQAKTARKHAGRHDSLEKDIRKLKGSIEKNEKELARYSF